MAKKKIMILDVETNHEQKVFDLSFLVGDLHGSITSTHQLIIEEIFPEHLFWEKKRPDYLAVLADSTHPAKMVKVAEAFNELKRTIEENKIDTVYAYNASFDYRAVEKLAYEFNIENPLDTVEIDCLWFWSVQTIFQQKNFIKWADKNAEYAISEKGNYKTTAEIAYAYMHNEPDFEEIHRGIEDCLIEYEIFLKCRQQKKLRAKGICYNAWILAQPEEQIIKLPTQFRQIKLNLEAQIEQTLKVANKLNKPLSASVQTA